MKIIIITQLLALIFVGAYAQGIYNNEAYIVSESSLDGYERRTATLNLSTGVVNFTVGDSVKNKLYQFTAEIITGGQYMKKDLNSTKEQLSLELNDLRNKSKEREEVQEAANQQLIATEQQLRAANQQLAANNQQLLATEQHLRTSNQQLIERLKELDCFYGISNIVEIPDISLEEIFRRTVKLIPASWQYPEIVVCRIILDDIEYKTQNFEKTKWCQSSDIIIDGKHIGNIEVCYLKEISDSDGPFLKEERLLLDALAERLGRITERKHTEEALCTSEEKYNVLSDNMIIGLVLHNANTEIIFSNPAARNILGLTEEQMLGKNAIDPAWHFCREDGSILPLAEFPVNKVVATNKSINDYIIGIKVPDRDFISWVSVNATPVFDNKKSLSYVTITFVDITERIQAEEKQKAANQQFRAANQQLDASNQQLSANEQQLRAANQQLIADEFELKKEKNFSEKIVETANAIIIGLDKDHIIKIFNKGAEIITGYTKAEVIGKDWFKLFFPKAMLDEMNKVWKNAWGISSHSNINPILSKTGKEIIVSWQNTGMYENEDASKHLLISIGENITKRKKAESELEATNKQLQANEQQLQAANQQLVVREAKYRRISENTPAVVYQFEMTPDGAFTFSYVNDSAKNILGVNAEDIINDSSILIGNVHPDDQQMFLNGVMKSAKTFETYHETFRYLKNGEIIWLECRTSPDLMKNGNILWDGFLVDITERKQAEEALKEKTKETQLLADMLDKSSQPFAVGSPDGKLTRVNSAFCNLTGYSNEELLNDVSWNETLTPKEWKEYEGELLQKLITTGEPQLFEKEYIHKNGKRIYVELLMHSKVDDNNNIQYVYGFITDITERKQAEEALKESEIKYRTLFENAPVLINAFDENGKCTLWNNQCKETFGWTIEELNESGDPLSLFYPDSEIYKEVIKTVSSAPDRKFREWKPYTKSGTQLVTMWANFKASDELTFNLGYDITERKQVDDKLKQSEQKHKLLIKNSPDLLMSQNIDGKLTYISPQCEDILGFTAEELMNLNIPEQIHPDDLEMTQKTMYITLLGKELKNLEYRFINKNGDIVWLNHTARPIFIDDKISEIQSTVSDITERKRNEQIQKIIHNISNAVNISHNIDEFIKFIRKELGTIIDTKNFYVALCDNKTKMISLLYHQDQKDRLEIFPQGKTLTNYVIKTKKPLLATKAVKDKLVKSGEVELLGNDSKIWLGIPLMIKEKVIGALAVQSYTDKKAFNKTDMHVLEIISNQISISLERKKAEEELKSALERAQESDRLKSAFLTNMSHEIRTPMNGILGFTGLLNDPQLTGDKQKSYIDIIEKSGDRMLNTINDIIDISIIEVGQVKVVKSEVSVNEILKEQYEFFNSEAQSKGLELICKPTLSDKEVIIVTDKHKLEGILTNLIKNAIKFTKHGNISFGYSLKKEKNFEGLEFFIKDTGIGIPSNRIHAVFNRFEQADIEDTQVFEGSGLGLAISKSYVEMLGGNISVTSEEGIGSTFVFSIPYTKQTTKESDAEGGINKIPQVSLNKLYVIVAEDDEISKMLLEAILENEFHKITYAETGKETVDKFRENPETNIILMDLKMNDMSGYEATREIRKFNKDVVIIAQTAYGLSGDREKAIEAGCDDYISKPINKELLFEKIMLHLSKRSI